jgi:ubiquinone/menaquinone biosynthesis C-methylase UbiE
MGLYGTYVAPHVINFACGSSGFAKWRARCVGDLNGRVVEIGFGAGNNLAHYPANVSEVVAIEPSKVMRNKAQRAIEEHHITVTWGGLDGQQLALDDVNFDAAVVTFALCTIEDPIAALRELRRVVKPGGELRVLEHGLAPDPAVARWQHRINGLEKVLADGCQLVRQPDQLVASAGWTITANYQRYAPGPKPWCYLTSLRAAN